LIEVEKIPLEDQVYVDECGIKEDLTREHGRAPRGVKVEDTRRGRSFHRVNVVAAVIHSRNGTKRIAPECYQGSMTGERFEKWMKDHLLANIESGKTIIMDNARFHRKTELKKYARRPMSIYCLCRRIRLISTR
jgi:hypothetical protein